jgi:hypothetical protein
VNALNRGYKFNACGNYSNVNVEYAIGSRAGRAIIHATYGKVEQFTARLLDV